MHAHIMCRRVRMYVADFRLHVNTGAQDVENAMRNPSYEELHATPVISNGRRTRVACAAREGEQSCYD